MPPSRGCEALRTIYNEGKSSVVSPYIFAFVVEEPGDLVRLMLSEPLKETQGVTLSASRRGIHQQYSVLVRSVDVPGDVVRDAARPTPRYGGGYRKAYAME